MARYLVPIQITDYDEIEVEADSEQEAIEIAIEEAQNDINFGEVRIDGAVEKLD